MNQKEINSLYGNIFQLLAENRFREAYSQIAYLIQQNTDPSLFEQLNTQESIYRNILHYGMQGVQDPQQENILNHMRLALFSIADKAYRAWNAAYSSRWYDAQWRYRKMNNKPAVNLVQLARVMQDSREELSILAASKNDFVTAPRRLQLHKQMAAAEADYFHAILFSEAWKKSDREAYQACFLEMNLSGQAMAVSALLLSLQECFDEYKLHFLMDLCLNEQPQVAMRALTAMLIVLLQHDARMAYYPALKAQWSLILDAPQLSSRLTVIYSQLLRAKFNDLITKKMQDELLPEMNKLSESLQDKFEGQDKFSIDKEDLNELFSDGAMNDAMQEFSELQTQGEDVYMSTFSQMKFYPFFKDIQHWFVPFYQEHPVLTEIFGKDASEGLGLLKVVTGSMFLCDSDKYSFCLNMTQVPEQYRASMIGNMGADSEQFKEMMEMEQNGNKQLKMESISNLYIQDLYRFYRLFPSHRDFADPFLGTLDFFSVEAVKAVFMEEDNLKKLAAMYLKKQQYASASRLYEYLLAQVPDNYDYLRSLAYAYEKQRYYNQAADTYAKADMLRADQVWVLKRWAYCCKQVDNYAKALQLYQRLAALQSDQASHLMNQAHCLMQMKDYDAALNAYYKVDFLFGESPKTWRPLAWCLLMKKQYEQSSTYYDKILAAQATMEDYLCYGHLKVAQAQYRAAVDAYEQAYRLSAMNLQDFYRRFDQDWKDLGIFGLDKSQLALLSDALRYRLEERV